MSSPRRMLAILDLFTAEHPIWAIDDIMLRLGYARATGYRYVKDLVEVGLLQKVSAGYYSLGGRVIELDYQLRQTDPVLRAARGVMDKLASRSGFDVVLSVLYPGPRVIDIHRVEGKENLSLSHGRGRPRPVFRGGAPKVLLAYQPRAYLMRLYQEHAGDIAINGMGSDWAEFRAYLAAIRKRELYVSIGELDPFIGAAAVPILNADTEIVAALAMVGNDRTVENFGEERLERELRRSRRDIENSLRASA